MFQAVLQGDDEREGAFRRALYVSVGAHLLLLGLAFVNPFQSRSFERPAGVVDVSLVAAVPGAQAAAPLPAAKPAPPKPAAKPKPPPEAAKPVPPPEPQVRADKKLLPKEAVKAPKPKPKPAPSVKPPERELDYDDALSSLREELGEPEDAGDAPDPELLASVKARPAGPAGMGGTGDPLDPLVAAWMKRVKIHVSRAWVLEPGFKRQILEAELVVSLDASGRVLGVEVQRRSGNPHYDESVVRALEKASPLPPPPEDGDWAFVFTPQDVL